MTDDWGFVLEDEFVGMCDRLMEARRAEIESVRRNAGHPTMSLWSAIGTGSVGITYDVAGGEIVKARRL